MNLTLSVLPETLAVCRLHPDAEIPPWAVGENLLVLVRTRDEFSVVCPQIHVPVDIHTEGGWRALKVHGPLDFSLVGVLAQIAGVLAEIGVSIFAISTYDTDYILVKDHQLETAKKALTQAGNYLLAR